MPVGAASSVDPNPPARPRTRHRPSATDRLVIGLLGTRLRPLLDRSRAVLRYVTPDGRSVAFPVRIARGPDRIVVPADAADRTRWWRRFLVPAPVDVRVDGRWRSGTGVVHRGADTPAAALDGAGRPRASVPGDAVVVVITLDGPLPPRPALRGADLAWCWFLVVTVAEVVGFVAPAVVGALTADAATAVTLPALLMAGAVEGALLGAGQAAVLRHALPGLVPAAWIVATTLGAVVAYLLGLVPSLTAAVWTGRPLALLLPVAVVLGLVLLTSIGAAQWWLLRRLLDRAAWWIAATALAWLVGLSVFLTVATPLWRAGQPVWLTVLIGLGAAVLMAASMAAVTGVALARGLPPAVGQQIVPRRPGRPALPEPIAGREGRDGRGRRPGPEEAEG